MLAYPQRPESLPRERLPDAPPPGTPGCERAAAPSLTSFRAFLRPRGASSATPASAPPPSAVRELPASPSLQSFRAYLRPRSAAPTSATPTSARPASARAASSAATRELPVSPSLQSFRAYLRPRSAAPASTQPAAMAGAKTPPPPDLPASPSLQSFRAHLRSRTAPVSTAPPADTSPVELGSEASSGARPYQHDVVLTTAGPTPTLAAAAVFDGHGESATGHVVSALCGRALPSKLTAHAIWAPLATGDSPSLKKRLTAVVAELEAEACLLNATAHAYAGSTLCVALASPGMLASVNVGDSRAVLASRGPDGTLMTAPLTRDQVPARPDERARIEANGGWVTRGSLNGYISMSRALGDTDLKEHRNRTDFKGKPDGTVFGERLFTAEPEVVMLPRDASQRFVIVASDGIWDTVSNESAVRIVDTSLRAGATADKAAATLVRRALAAGSADNLAAAVLVLDRAAAPEYSSRWGRLVPRKKSLGIRNRLRKGLSREDLTVHGAHAYHD